MYGGGHDLDTLVRDLESRTGVRAAIGGRHDTAGTHNALVGLGPGRYLELIAADPEGDPRAPLGRMIRALAAPRLLAWAVATDDLDGAVARARASGYDPGAAEPLRRQRPDQSWLAWRLAWRGEGVFRGIVPFLIEWGACPHPATSAPHAGTLLTLRAEHPEPTDAAKQLAALGVTLATSQGPEPRLCARIETPNGVVALR